MTKRLFADDPYLKEFSAKVIRLEETGGNFRVVLDRTAFFPTGGGQPHDTGAIGPAEVVDVVEEGGEIVHILSSRPPEGAVVCKIDWERRLDHMQQHDGQHILSQAFIRSASAETTSFHLGKEVCTIDLDRTIGNEEKIAEAERLANEIVFENRPIEAKVYRKNEIPDPALLRKLPPDEEDVRIVNIGDFDLSACCGTHPRRSGEVVLIKILGTEKVKGGTRVSFICGGRILRRLADREGVVAQLSAKLSVLPTDMASAVDRLIDENKGLKKHLEKADDELAVHLAKKVCDEAETIGGVKSIVVRCEGKGIKYLVKLGNLFRSESRANVAIMVNGSPEPAIVMTATDGTKIDLRQPFHEAITALGGKGGGQPYFVQGGGGDPQKVHAALKAAEEYVKKILQDA